MHKITASESKIIAIVWAPHEARTAMFAKLLNAKLYNIHFLKYKQPFYAPFKYVLQWLKTWQVLRQERPDYVYVTNPPVFAAMCVALYCMFNRTRYIVDTHPPSLYSKKWAWSVPLQRWVIKRAHMNVTDQDRFAKQFEDWGGRAVVLENPPKEAPVNGTKPSITANRFDVTVINTFAEDEPVQPILDAAKQLPNVNFYILGEKKRAGTGILRMSPANVVFTDYLRGEDYWNRLHHSRAVMVLTTFPYSLLGGAHDGMILHKPLILSNQPALTEYFTKGTVFVENTAEGIITGIKEVQQNEQRLIEEISQLPMEREKRWAANYQTLQQFLKPPA